MQLKESFEKNKIFIHKSVKNAKSLILSSYEKFPKSASCNPFLCGIGNTKKHKMDRYYTEFCNEWECSLNKELNMKKNKMTSLVVTEEAVCGETNGCDQSSHVRHSIMSPLKEKQDGLLEQKAKSVFNSRKGEQCSKRKDNGGYTLAKKLKELEMMDVGDVEHELDVEEALHYYSRLKSPVYLEMVDKFFTDMYEDISVPQASGRLNSAKRRLSSIRL